MMVRLWLESRVDTCLIKEFHRLYTENGDMISFDGKQSSDKEVSA